MTTRTPDDKRARTMPVYMVYICHSVSDRALLEKYWASIGPTLEGQPLKLLAAYTPFEVLEGENVLGVFVAEWPSMEAAKAWYDSRGYRAIRHLRMDNAKYTGLLVESGVAPPEQRLRNRIGRGPVSRPAKTATAPLAIAHKSSDSSVRHRS